MNSKFSPLLVFFLVITLTNCFSQTIEKPTDNKLQPEYGSLDYWQIKMQDRNTNFNTFKEEFENYWKGKTPQKGSGYKQVSRWIIHQQAYANPDGTLRMPADDIEQALGFMQQMSSMAVTGNWNYAAPFNPVYNSGNPTLEVAGMGRVTAIGFSPHNNYTVYVGAPLGGLWRSTDFGVSWTNMNTDVISALGVSAIAVHPSDPSILFIGTGDRDAEKTLGQGIYKSLDGGLTWTAKPISTRHDKAVHKIYFHPSNPDIMTISSNYGIYKSLDGGETWQKKLAVYLIDSEQKPGSPFTIYAAGKNILYKSIDFGDTWTTVLTVPTHRIAIGVTPANPNRVLLFTTKDSKFYRVYRSSNSGATFDTIFSTGTSPGEGQGGYNLDLVIDPNNENIVYAGMVNFYKSVDGGATFVNQEAVYADDQHIFEFHPVTHRLFIGNDSGIWYTDDGNNYTYSSNGLNITTCYRIDVSSQNATRIISGNQDAATFVTLNGITYRSIGGDGMTCKFDFSDENYVYGSAQNGYVARSINGGGVNAAFSGIAANGSHGIDQEANFQSAFAISSFNPNTMYYGAHDVWRSFNIKATNPASVVFTKISNDIAGTDSLRTIEYMEPSKANPDILYVTYDNGRMFRSDNVNSVSPTWIELPQPNSWRGVRFESHPTDPNIVYMVRGKYVYRSANKGESWTSITQGFPDLVALSIIYMNGSDEGLYVGTTAGVYYKDNTMTSWIPFKSGLPLTQVRDMAIHYATIPAQLFAGTFGRGVWKTSVLPSYIPDLISGNGISSINGCLVSAYNSFTTSNSQTTMESFTNGYYLSVDQIINDEDYLIQEEELSQALPSASFQSEIISVDAAHLLPSLPTGSYYLGFMLDNDNNIQESNENNNTWVAPQMVTIPDNPAAPTNVQASDGTFSDKISISWVNNTGEQLYFAVFRAESIFDLAPDQISSSWSTALSYDDYSVVPGQTYYYRIKASRYPDGVRPSVLSAYNTGHTALSIPVDVEASDGQFGDRIEISWPAVTGATHYRVYRSLTPVATEQNVISGPTWISGNFFSDNTAVIGNIYYYWVRAAMNEFGQYATDWSEANTGYIGFVSAPDANASDGSYTDRVVISWNAIAGASHYRLYRGTFFHPSASTAISTWQTSNSFTDYTASTAVKYYYWVRASQDATGTIATGYGAGDAGYRNFVTPAVTASDGTSELYTTVSWSAVTGASYYKVYRRAGIIEPYTAISSWTTRTSRMDNSGVPGLLYDYTVKVSSDTTYIISANATANSGYRRIAAPVVTATVGTNQNMVGISWEPAEGASYYRVQRSTVENPSSYTTIANYSNTLNFTYQDFTAVPNQRYNYRVNGAVNSSGLRAGSYGLDIGMAGSCSNLVEEDAGMRSVNLHGTTLDIGFRLANWGYFNLSDSVSITVYLESIPANGTPEVILGTKKIPPLAVDESYDVVFSADAGNIPGFDFTYGNWQIALNLSCDNGTGNCDNNADDNYLIWQTPLVNHTDAMHGIYTIGSTACDFESPAYAIEALHSRGISDPVTFYLLPEVFTEQLQINTISGVGTGKQIVFTRHPDFADTATIIAMPAENRNYTIKLTNCSYITFEQLHLSTLGASDFMYTYGRVVDIGQGCSNLIFRNNKITGFSDNSHPDDANSVIYSSYTGSSNLLIEGNRIESGYIGINISGSSSSTNYINNLVIKDNVISGFFYKGMFLFNINHLEVTHNKISSECIDSWGFLAGMHCSNIHNGFNISNNDIRISGINQVNYGMSLTDLNMDGTQNGIISNNLVSIDSYQANNYGLSLYKINNTSLLHNTVHIYGTAGNFSVAMILQGGTDEFEYSNTFYNNNVVSSLNGYSLAVFDFAENPDFIANMDYNNYLTTGSDLFLIDDVPYNNLQAWRALSGKDSHSVSIDPGFVSNTDLHCTNIAFDNKGTPCQVTLDIDNEPRSLTTPDIGADEFPNVPTQKNLTLQLFLEGLYNGSGTMRQSYDENGPHFGTGIADQLVIELRSATAYSNIVFTSPPVNLSTNGMVNLTIPGTLNGTYYVTIKHRNSIETTTALPVSFSGNNVAHNFDNPSKAYGGNLLMMIDGRYVIYGGDVNQDGYIDTGDMTPVDNDSANFASGYLNTDVNGDGFVDTGDMTIIDNNSAGFVGAVTP